MRAKAITLSQPHASLVDFRWKKVETRGWRIEPGTILVIHSARTIKHEYLKYFDHPAFVAALSGRRPADMVLGCGLCVVRVLASVKTEELHKLSVINFTLSGMEQHFGIYTDKRYAIPLEHLGRFPVPIAASGLQSLWTWPHEIDLAELVPVEDPVMRRQNVQDAVKAIRL